MTETGYPPLDDRESTIVIRLEPGTYTVVLEGKNGGTGVGILETNEY